MKISCLPVSLFQNIIGGELPLSNWIALAQDCGCDGADVSMQFFRGHAFTYLQEIKAMLAKQSIPLVMCVTYPDFTHYDCMQRKRELTYLYNDIALCSEMGIPYLRVLAGQAHPQTPIREGVAHAIACLRECAKVAEDFGVILLYENHAKPSAWQYIDLTYPPELFLQVLEGIWDTSIRVNFDIGNVVAHGSNALALLEQIYEKVETVHVSDMAQMGEFSPVAIGTGTAPLKEIFAFLNANGFTGWLCIEEASFQGEQGIRAAVDIVKRLVNESIQFKAE